MNECIRDDSPYALRYDEKLTKSEVVVFAYHLFKKMTWKEQQKWMKCEERDGKERGNFVKISVSLLPIGYRCLLTEEPKTGDLRAALYSLLRNKKFWAIVGIASIKQ